VEEFEPKTTTYALRDLSDTTVAFLIREKTVTPELAENMQKIMAQKHQLADFNQSIDERQHELSEISQDQQRVRENMKALKGTAEEKQLTQRYASQLNQQEDRLLALRKEITDLQTQRTESADKLSKMIEGISLDVAL
jgi:septal ring factor EnvC (AmiA/AmiB activator)